MKKQAVIGIICCICMLCAACGNAAEPAPTPKPVEATVGKVVEVTEEIITIQTTEDATHTFERQNAQLKLNGYRLMEGDRVEVQHRNPYEALVITLVEPGEEAKRYRVVDDLLAGMSVPLRYNKDKREKPVFSRGLSVCRSHFNPFSNIETDAKI